MRVAKVVGRAVDAQPGDELAEPRVLGVVAPGRLAPSLARDRANVRLARRVVGDERTVEQQLEADMSGGAAWPARATMARERVVELAHVRDDRREVMERGIRGVMQGDAARDAFIMNLAHAPSDHGREIGQHRAEHDVRVGIGRLRQPDGDRGVAEEVHELCYHPCGQGA
jgi:hypothetical protein